jgi:hypothetical protein
MANTKSFDKAIPLTISLRTSLVESLKKTARREGVSVSALVTRMVRAALKVRLQ